MRSANSGLDGWQWIKCNDYKQDTQTVNHPAPPGPQRHPREGLLRGVRGGILLPFALQNDRALSIEEIMETRNARIGFVLFVVYSLLYGGFVFLNAFAADVMEMTPIAGVNLAILYGFGLIVAALILALVYGFLCKEERADEEGEK